MRHRLRCLRPSEQPFGRVARTTLVLTTVGRNSGSPCLARLALRARLHGMERFAEEELRLFVTDYEATKKAALAKRDATLQAFHAAGWRPVDIQRVTGYSRETIRQALRPEVRRAANAGRRKNNPVVVVRPPDDYQPYSARKPYVVADSIDDLHGPTQGTVRLPHHLDWSGDATYDLAKPARLASMYKTVLNEAVTVDDLNASLDGALLVQVWPSLWLPPRLRHLWEQRFPQLAAFRGADSA